MDRGAWLATVHGGHIELDTIKQLCTIYTQSICIDIYIDKLFFQLLHMLMSDLVLISDDFYCTPPLLRLCRGYGLLNAGVCH